MHIITDINTVEPETPETRYQEKLVLMQTIHAEISTKPRQKTWNDAISLNFASLENSPETYGKDPKRFVVVGQSVKCQPMPELDRENGFQMPRRKGVRSLGRFWSL